MEMQQIRYFLAVCDTLNFTRAAEKCNVTQPALTRAIQKLEEELGGLLFRRERNLSHVTDLGRLMRPHLEHVLEETEAAKSTAKGFMKLENAPLKLGVMCSIGPMRLVGFLAHFRRQNPGVALSLKETMPGELLELLIEGELDLAILARPEPLGERFDRLPLYRESYVAAFPQGHRFEGMNAVPLEAIADECVMSRANCEYHDYVGSICRARSIKAEAGYSSEREDWIQSMVAAGIGICLFWEFSPTLPGIVTRPVIEPEIAREISMVWVAGRRFSPAASVFARAIRSHRWEA